MASNHPPRLSCEGTFLKTHIWIFLLAVAMLTPDGHATEPVPRMTGARLLDRLESVEPAKVAWGPESKASREELAYLQTARNIEFVQGYIAALYDATEGKDWCYNSKYKSPKPDTFWDESRWGLYRLPPAQLRRNAAELLVAIWREKWPCAAIERGRQK
jgi:hypothetical protein